jgi:mRNA interferase HicA
VKRTRLLKEIAKLAKAHDKQWTLIREGAKHSLYAFGDLRVTVPRHAEINEVTAKGILKDIEDAS